MMANQYSGRPATDEEKIKHKIMTLESEVKSLEGSIDYIIETLTAKYKRKADPDICRILLIHGVKVHDIDRALGRDTVYTTPRNAEEFWEEEKLSGMIS